ncbi:hypothetical protein M426DRAFT_322966 [Hypoxylon sp. CI-4A]|nr:hypothetical protein M426DRAFT_322966 [Hypoxylon sp. CI-4A]
MASEKGPVATEAPPFSSSTEQPTISSDPVSVETLTAEAARATQSLKRQRESSPVSPSSALSALHRELSPSKAARLIGLTSRFSPAPLTGAAAVEDERRREEEQYKLQVSGASENPAFKAQSALMSASALAMSRPQEAPQEAPQDAPQDVPQEAPQEAPQDAPHNIPQHFSPEAHGLPEDVPQADDMQPAPPPPVSIPHPDAPNSGHKSDNISPQSATSLASLGGGPSGPVTSSPGPMELDGHDNRSAFGAQPQAPMEDKAVAASLSYPGILPPTSNMPAPPVRGMSMPMTPNQPNAPRSPNSKRHKCPYCETEFTRHHNLKSHLLTHSQEKPYVCQTCSMRFRRLHDLKRHTKLHTGEKPHVCPKCDRKFARGDALARHSKGPGGCVGRRSSLGSFLGEEEVEGASHIEGDDSAMTGIVYDGNNDTDMTEEERRRLSVPGIKAQHVQGNQSLLEKYVTPFLTQQQPGSAAGRLYPPNVDRDSGSSNTSQTPSTSISSLPVGTGNPAMYAQSAMTESPKPLSPSNVQGHDPANINRQRSPSLTAQFQQQHFGRPSSDRHTPPVPGFSAADASARYTTIQGPASASQSAPGGTGQQAAPGPAVSHSHTSSGPSQNGGSGDSSSNNIFATDQGIWAYIHGLEEQVRQLNDRVQAMEAAKVSQDEKITYLSNEVAGLRGQPELKGDVVDKIS